LAAGCLLAVLYFVGVSLTGIDALRDALNPFNRNNYVVVIPLLPGAFLLWLGDAIVALRRRQFKRS
jgi:hypothetical protein